ncbi:MAG: DUF262 domain-containing protein [Anaerolineae bacterium]|nr:DUF262 domain-containing protein [Anaerolineae bacterium]
MEIGTILNQIDLGAMALPEFQRGYVWNRNQVRDLMASLYRRHPVGGLLVWVTKTGQADARGNQTLSAGNVELILDGQQRVTSLYGIIRGTPPPFFEGNKSAFTDLHFNMADEKFEFYGLVKMRDNPHWVSVTDLMKQGLTPFINRITQDPHLQLDAGTYIERLSRLQSIEKIQFHIEKVTGPDKTVDVVVDIFNQVNSGGTKLSKGDLALARICAEWPDARQALRSALKSWSRAGFYFKMDWLLRNINVVLTGEALFSALKDVDAQAFESALKQTEKAINYLLNLIGGRLGLDHDRVLGGRYALPIMARYVVKNGGQLDTAAKQNRLLYWYIHSILWGRFAGSTESVLNQDLAAMESSPDPLGGLIDQLRIWRGDLVVRPENFAGWSLGARFYPMLYLLTRVGDAQDWGTGLPLKAGMLGKTSQLQVHHIFPKSQLYQRNLGKAQVNALANFCFLTQTTNLTISNTLPEKYFPEIEAKHPGALASQWIPLDEQLWKTENYLDFLRARQTLLATAANDFLDSLLISAATQSVADDGAVRAVATLGGIDGQDEEELLLKTNIWVDEQGLPEGELLYELTNKETGEVMALLDLAWPLGVQTGLSEPVALLIDEDIQTLEVASEEGFRCFTDVESFKNYVTHEVLALEMA